MSNPYAIIQSIKKATMAGLLETKEGDGPERNRGGTLGLGSRKCIPRAVNHQSLDLKGEK